MLNRLLKFWLQNIYPSVALLIATLGTVGLGGCLLSLWLLAHLFEEILEQESFAFDEAILLWIHQFANPGLDRLMLLITHLANPEVAIPLTGITVGLLLWRRYFQEAQIFLIACLGGTILNVGLKLLFSRVRPELWPRLITETSFSFPSGHALGSVVLYGMIGYLLAQHYLHWSRAIYGLALSIIAAISLSRLYLGVHWPTDILAGWSIGFVWVMICIALLRLRRLQYSGDYSNR